MNRPVYTSQTGIVSDDEPDIIEHVVARAVRIDDPKYGLKSAAKKAFEARSRAAWQAGKQAALAKEQAKRDEINSTREQRLAVLDADILRIRTALLTGTSSSPEQAKKALTTLETKRAEILAKVMSA